MKPEGIRVVELNLSLPGTFYYLYWSLRASLNDKAGIRRDLDAARRAARELGWKILAIGTRINPLAVHVLFQTTTANLERGLADLLDPGARYRIHVVQAGAAVRQLRRHIQCRRDGDKTCPTSHAATELPDVHFGLFMGERDWAENMLAAMSTEEPPHGPGTSSPPSLADFAREYPGKRKAIVEAYCSERFSLKEIAEFFDMHFSEVSAIVNASMMSNRNRAV